MSRLRNLSSIKAPGQDKGAVSNGVNIVQHRRRWYVLSLLLLIPGLVALWLFGLKLGIDFTGGSVVEISRPLPTEQISQLAEGAQLHVVSITSVSGGGQLISYRGQEDGGGAAHNQRFQQGLVQAGVEISRYEEVGPTVSGDTARGAFISIGLVSLVIVIYIAYAFRKVPPPAKPLNMGLIAIGAMLHDALFVVGTFALLGHFFNIEIDAFFVTAVLTIITFSIHDTIVVFDRIRENLTRGRGHGSFAETVNQSVNEVMVRSFNTSLVVILVLLALFLFGGLSTRYFVLALMIGMATGVYSSIFIASPLLVTLNLRNQPKK